MPLKNLYASPALCQPFTQHAGWLGRGPWGVQGVNSRGASGALANVSTPPAVHSSLHTASTAEMEHTLSLPLIAETN